MKRSSPLVWLCAAAAAVLSAVSLWNPGGVYTDYIASLERGTPTIAAVFAAAQDGVYPWTPFTASEPVPQSPVYRPLNESVTDEEMRASIGESEPFAAPETPAPVPADFAAPEEPAEEAAEEPADEFVTVDESWFDDALFIGDSHTEGLCDYGILPNATYYYKRGVDVWSIMKKNVVGGKMTIPEALAQNRFGKIYIMLGINEIACGTTESFAGQYAAVVAQIRELQPDALIYIQAIFHTSQRKSDNSVFKNEVINERNEAISHIADGEHVFFIDCNAVFDDENGALTSSYTGDGVHVMAPYYPLWRDYLLQFGRSAVPAAKQEEPEPEPKPAVREIVKPGTASDGDARFLVPLRDVPTVAAR